MAIENAKMFNVRIKNKYDSYENWVASGLVLEAGEIAIAHTTVDVKVDNGTAKHPALLMKVGNGTDLFKDLPWMSAKAADVLAVCKDEAELKTFINGVIADAGIATDEALTALSGKVATAEGKISTLESDLNTAETGLKAKMVAAEAAIAALDLLVGDDSVADQIKTYVDNLNLGGTYEAKGEAAKVNTALETYKTSNDAAVKKVSDDLAGEISRAKVAEEANAGAIAGIKDGTTIDSFADVESALAGKETSGAAAQALADAKVYADGLAKNYDAKGAAADAETAAKAYAKEYADGLAKNYDAVGSAAQALTDAKAYTDGFTGGKTVAESINAVIANYSTTEQMNTAIATAKGEAVSHANGLNTAMDARVQVVEGKAHEHTFVESELNLIKAGDVEKWNAAEKNAKDYADGLDEAMDARVLALEGKFTGNDSVAKQISDAVAAEAALREAADTALQNQIGTASAEGVTATGLHARIEELEELVGDDKVSEAIAAAVKVEKDRAEGIEGGLETRLAAVEADYLTSTDKEALQTQINTIMSNPDAEGAINSINEFTQYVKDHGTIAEGMRNDINKNKEDIATEKSRAEGIEAGLQTAINGVAADVEALEGVVATKAAQADHEALAGRVTTVEGKVTTLEGEMDSAEGRLNALEGLTGGKKVSDAIDEAIEAALKVEADGVKVDKYALASALAAAIAQHNTDKAALETEMAKKANDADLATVAKSGLLNDLSIAAGTTLVFDCGGAGV